MGTRDPLLKMLGVCKEFPGVKALNHVDFELRHGEIHAVCGENGAGKSTLIKVLTGVEIHDSGEIILEGRPIRPRTPMEAPALGISTVYQEVNLCPNLSVAENIFVGREPMRGGKIDWDDVNRRSAEALARLNVKLDVTARLDEYSVAIQQMVAIARALDISAKILVLDEPTSSLNKTEVANLFRVMRKLKSAGIGIIFITHFLEQVYEITDRITILRNGQLVGQFETASLDRLQLIAKMIGKDLEEFEKGIKESLSDTASAETEGVYYRATQLGQLGSINPFDISIGKGEVMGLAGLLGSGRTESARVIFGIDAPDSGDVSVNGESVSIRKPADAIRLGFGFCSENRKTEGIVANLTIRENIVLALQGKRGLLAFLTRKEQEEIADKYVKLLNIVTPSIEQLVGNLSGGNQQKVLLARWLATDPELLILDEPTRGIDIGAKAEVQKLVLQLSGEGKAVLLISSELDEMVRCCSRMAVYKDKHKIGELRNKEISELNVMKTIAGGLN
ncbi:sugar ABC transporter ATP-binding protein [Propionivibrio dicarboxylicus]|uniref:Simple sugar transport system ATP-binding protein n=1 Tax=Propionivibrio dicarboxylicus TaxID=83767 RepID=A0A1G8H017_9RHOO|nr:sugar ABC transporter ATP-binding protein [Propionivibrio dicarboxylicus]SDI00022.1 simple sugar transport system ATP-binding protein [Propionivibrio dicarboxylicus]